MPWKRQYLLSCMFILLQLLLIIGHLECQISVSHVKNMWLDLNLSWWCTEPKSFTLCHWHCPNISGLNNTLWIGIVLLIKKAKLIIWAWMMEMEKNNAYLESPPKGTKFYFPQRYSFNKRVFNQCANSANKWTDCSATILVKFDTLLHQIILFCL